MFVAREKRILIYPETRRKSGLTSYILNSPELTLPQFGTPVAMEYSWDECSWKGPVFTEWIREIDRKYKLVGGREGRRIDETGISV
jgi:hypothetical protein